MCALLRETGLRRERGSSPTQSQSSRAEFCYCPLSRGPEGCCAPGGAGCAVGTALAPGWPRASSSGGQVRWSSSAPSSREVLQGCPKRRVPAGPSPGTSFACAPINHVSGTMKPSGDLSKQTRAGRGLSQPGPQALDARLAAQTVGLPRSRGGPCGAVSEGHGGPQGCVW